MIKITLSYVTIALAALIIMIIALQAEASSSGRKRRPHAVFVDEKWSDPDAGARLETATEELIEAFLTDVHLSFKVKGKTLVDQLPEQETYDQKKVTVTNFGDACRSALSRRIEVLNSILVDILREERDGLSSRKRRHRKGELAERYKEELTEKTVRL